MVARPQAEQKSRKASCRCQRFESIAVEDSEMNLNGYHTPAIRFILRTCVPLLRVGVGVFATPTRNAIYLIKKDARSCKIGMHCRRVDSQR